VAAAIVVGALENGPREEPHEPSEEWFVTHMHADNDVRTRPVEPEVAFADKEAGDDATFQVVEVIHAAEEPWG
jgi:hypothetical protein